MDRDRGEDHPLRATYAVRQGILGADLEEFEAVRLVDSYRAYWRPETVNVILLAESHVYITRQDMAIAFESALPGFPSQYAKFVYCLAYGERQLTGSDLYPARDGTPQFWKLFHACLNPVTDNSDFVPVLSVTPPAQRLA